MPKIKTKKLRVRRDKNSEWIDIPAVGGAGSGGITEVPLATAETVGGIYADSAGEYDTQPAKIGEDGHLYVTPYDLTEEDKSAIATQVTEEAVEVILTEVTGGGSVPIASKESPGVVAVGENLKISETGALSVDTTDVAEEDNTKPITSSGVNTIVGNIGAILETI